MSDLKRYMLDGFVDDNALFEHDFGEWVKHADVEQQQSQIDRLNKVVEAAQYFMETFNSNPVFLCNRLSCDCGDICAAKLLHEALAELEPPEATK